MERKLFGIVDNFDSVGKPAGAIGPCGTVSTRDRYARLRYLARDALEEAYGKFREGYVNSYRERPRFAQSRQALQMGLQDFLRGLPTDGEPSNLGDMLEEL